MLKNALSYITRKKLKSIIIFAIILIMATLSLVSISIKNATNNASKETFKNITNSFSMQINRTPHELLSYFYHLFLYVFLLLF